MSELSELVKFHRDRIQSRSSSHEISEAGDWSQWEFSLSPVLARDRGIAMLCRFFRKQIEIVASGGNPAGTTFDERNAMVKFKAGNYLE